MSKEQDSQIGQDLLSLFQELEKRNNRYQYRSALVKYLNGQRFFQIPMEVKYHPDDDILSVIFPFPIAD